MSATAYVHVKPVRKPISEEIIGFRLEAAVPNMAGRVMRAKKGGDGQTDGFYATGEPQPSWRKPYLITQSSDHRSIRPTQLKRFLDDLRWQGFDHFEYFGKCGDVPLAEVAAEVR